MITVLGASGFIGSYIVASLRSQQREVYAPLRNEDLANKDLGNVIYCIGLTADFRTRPFDTVEAHIGKLKWLLQHGTFTSLTYLSSTRLYLKSKSSNEKLNENDDLVFNANDPYDLFGASKITAELLLLNSGLPGLKVVRLSNVFGNDFYSENFITSIVKDALMKGKVELQTTRDSSKDYISVNDVTRAIIALAGSEASGVYNLSYGSNITNEAITAELARITGTQISYLPDAKKVVFQEIDNTKLYNELKFKPTISVLEALPDIVKSFAETISKS
ncbi:MAG TPA: NAD(P)-dependent oxidoreductase [Bacteroidia bacterium]